MDWPLAHMAQLSDHFNAHGLPVIFHIGPGEDAIEQQLRELCDVAPFFTGQGSSLKVAMDIPQLAALAHDARCFISNSTGPCTSLLRYKLPYSDFILL